jgi:hypothetical protein
MGGTLADPTIGPDRLSLAKGVAGATIGTLINPLGILVPLVSSGTGDENPCAAALTKAKPAAADENANGIGGALKDVGDSLRSLLGN